MKTKMTFENMPRLKISKSRELGLIDRIKVGLKLLTLFTIRIKEPVKLEVMGSGSYVIIDSMDYLELVLANKTMLDHIQGNKQETVPSHSAKFIAGKIFEELNSLPDLSSREIGGKASLKRIIKTYTDQELNDLYGADVTDSESK